MEKHIENKKGITKHRSRVIESEHDDDSVVDKT